MADLESRLVAAQDVQRQYPVTEEQALAYLDALYAADAHLSDLVGDLRLSSKNEAITDREVLCMANLFAVFSAEVSRETLPDFSHEVYAEDWAYRTLNPSDDEQQDDLSESLSLTFRRAGHIDPQRLYTSFLSVFTERLFAAGQKHHTPYLDTLLKDFSRDALLADPGETFSAREAQEIRADVERQMRVQYFPVADAARYLRITHQDQVYEARLKLAHLFLESFDRPRLDRALARAQDMVERQERWAALNQGPMRILAEHHAEKAKDYALLADILESERESLERYLS